MISSTDVVESIVRLFKFYSTSYVFFTEHPESSSSEELLMGPAPYGAEQTCKLIIILKSFT